MAAQDYASVVQQLYVSYFGRPADPNGLQSFESQLDAIGAPKTFAEVQAAVQADTAGTSPLSQLVNSFNSSAESTALYGNDNSLLGTQKFVAAIYQNVLGREADTTGFNFWVDAIRSGSLTKANAAAAITAGAMTNTTAQGKLDAQTVANKLSVATTFTTSLDTPSKIIAFSGTTAAAAAAALLQGVNSTTDVTAYQSSINTTIGTIVGGSQPGQTFSLTVGVDTPATTAGNDIINVIPQNATGADADTLGAFDVIDGGAGNDTLNLYNSYVGTTGYNLTQQGTVRNVETINIYNQNAAHVFAGSAGVDASKFVGATNINQIGAANKVINLAAATTASFTNTQNAAGAAGLNVAAADAAATTKVALKDVTGDATTNVVDLAVSGKALSSVTVSGNIAKANTAASADAASLALAVTAGANSSDASLSKVTINTSVKTTLTVNDGGSVATAHVTNVDASGSTGDVAYVAGSDVSTIATGSGADEVTISFATAAAAGSTAAKNASVMTGAGNDKITVSTTGTGLTTVDAGAGNDNISVTKVAGAGLNITGGDGNDTVVIAGAALATTDVIDGGAGTDAVSVAGSATRTADDFIVFNKLVKNFETIQFSSAEGASATALDASLLGSNYTTIDLATGSFITKVGAQAIVANGALTATASGYSNPSSGPVYAGTLNITEKATGTVTANADVVKLAVNANDAGDVTGTLAGDAQSAIVTLTNSVKADGSADTIANLSLTTSSSVDKNLASITLSGNGAASITNADGTKLVTVDATALGGTLTVGSNAGNATDGLTYVSTNTAVETIKLGSGVDDITLSASTYGKVDTVTGLNLAFASGSTTTLAASSDHLTVTGATSAVKFTTTQTDLDLALKDAASYKVGSADADTVVFTFGGDTYVYHDGGTAGSVDAADVLVKITGTSVNLDALIVSLG